MFTFLSDQQINTINNSIKNRFLLCFILQCWQCFKAGLHSADERMTGERKMMMNLKRSSHDLKKTLAQQLSSERTRKSTYDSQCYSQDQNWIPVE